MLGFPLEGEWYVLNGGRSIVYNHHYSVPSQRDAIDLITVDGEAAMGRPVVSPASGTVMVAADQDHPEADGPAGNHVVIDIDEGQYVLLAHLREGSLDVVEGDEVSPGDPIGRVGDTGNSSEPHLHIQVQDAPALDDSNRTWPIHFRSVTLSRGSADVDTDTADLRRDDRVRPRVWPGG